MKLVVLTIGLLLLPIIALAQQPLEQYTLKVKPAELDKIGKGLGKLPFDDVAELIQNLRQQIVEQSATKPVDKELDKK